MTNAPTRPRKALEGLLAAFAMLLAILACLYL